MADECFNFSYKNWIVLIIVKNSLEVEIVKQQIKILLAERRLHELIQTERSNVYRLTTILLAQSMSFY